MNSVLLFILPRNTFPVKYSVGESKQAERKKKKTDPGKRSSLLELQKHVGFKVSNYFQKLMKHVNSYIFASLINILLNIVNSDKTELIANND